MFVILIALYIGAALMYTAMSISKEKIAELKTKHGDKWVWYAAALSPLVLGKKIVETSPPVFKSLKEKVNAALKANVSVASTKKDEEGK